MNNFFKLLTLSLFAVIVIGCGETKDYSEDYKKAVKENDFEKAHDILGEIYDNFEKVWNDNFSGLEYDNDNRTKIEVAATDYARAASYILGAEVRYLISEKPDMANDKIEYLFNEMVILGEKVPEGSPYSPGGVKERQEICAKYDCYKQTIKYNNEVCDVVLNLAIKTKNQELAELALSHYLDNGVLVDAGITNTIKYENADEKKAKEKFYKAFSSPEEWLKNEIDEISNMTIDGERLHKGLVDYFDGIHAKYPASLGEYHKRLDAALDQAISQDNKALALRILKLYKQNMIVFKGGSSHRKEDKHGYARYFEIAPDGTEVDGDHCYVYYDYTDRDAAQQKFNEHFGK